MNKEYKVGVTKFTSEGGSEVLELAFRPSEGAFTAMVASLNSFNSMEMASVFDISRAFILKKLGARREQDVTKEETERNGRQGFLRGEMKW